MLTLTKRNRIFHIVLLVLAPFTISTSIHQQASKNITIPQSFAELQTQDPFLLPQKKLMPYEQDRLLQDIQLLRKIAQNAPIHIVHYQPPAAVQKKIDQCMPNNCEYLETVLATQPVTVEVPSNLRPVLMILHSDVPVNWQFGTGNQFAKGLFFTGFSSSSIVSSQFSGGAPKMFSFQYHQTCEFGPLCHFTQIDNLQQYLNEQQYRQQVEMLLQRKVDKFTVLTTTL